KSPYMLMKMDVVTCAMLSRLWVSLMAILSAIFITPYDTSNVSHSSSIFRAFASWDGVYYVDMAKNGYVYENTHAFFPLFSLLARYLGSVLGVFLEETTAIIVAGWIISNVCFVLAARYLYLLGKILLQNDTLAGRSAVFFCFCPSGIFMSSCYSESLMCFLSFGGMYYLELYRTQKISTSRTWHLILSSIFFGLASATRSNGLLLSLYIAYYRLVESPSPIKSFMKFLSYWTFTALLGLVATGLQVLYFAYGIAAYCPSFLPYTSPIMSLFGITSHIQTDRPWCEKVIPNISAMYMFIQKEYWGVGAFAYYQLKQIPNFVLAMPMLTLAAYSLQVYFRVSSKTIIVLPAQLRPYMVHLGFLLANALVVLHIQVITRFLCANPPVFWAAGHLSMTYPTASKLLLLYFLVFTVLGSVILLRYFCVEPLIFWAAGHRSMTNPTASKLLLLYFLVFTDLGSVMFSPFYPWTQTN
ncbi:GPI mannosyltransferase, partial [Thraustotheca clavata]